MQTMLRSRNCQICLLSSKLNLIYCFVQPRPVSPAAGRLIRNGQVACRGASGRDGTSEAYRAAIHFSRLLIHNILLIQTCPCSCRQRDWQIVHQLLLRLPVSLSHARQPIKVLGPHGSSHASNSRGLSSALCGKESGCEQPHGTIPSALRGAVLAGTS